MSHITRIQIAVADKELIRKAVKRMGYTLMTGKMPITAYNGDVITPDMILGECPSVGFKKEGSTYSIVGEFYKSKLDEVTFKDQLMLNYGAELVIAKATAVGHRIVSEKKVGEEIHLEVQGG